MPDNDELQSRKVSLEIANLVQQQEKTSLEIERLRRPWYRDAEYVFKALAIPLTVIAILLSFIAQNVQNDLKEAKENLATVERNLDNAGKDLNARKAETATLQKELEAKKVGIARLESERDELATERRNLLSANRVLEKTNDGLSLEREKMQGDRDHLRDSVSELRRKQETLEFEFQLAAISSDKPGLGPPWYRDAFNEEMIRLLNRDLHNRNVYIEATERTISSSNDWRVRTVLLHNLYLVTNEEIWKRHLMSALLEEPVLNPESRVWDPASLAKAVWAPIWEDSERVQLGLAILRRARERKNPRLFDVVFGGMWRSQLRLREVREPNANEALLDLVLDGIAVSRDVARDQDEQWELRRIFLIFLRNISNDACLAVVGTILSDPTTREETRLGVREFLRSAPDIPKGFTEVDPDAPTLIGALSRDNTDALWWKNWKEKNQEWVDLFMEPSLKTLRQRILQEKRQGVR